MTPAHPPSALGPPEGPRLLLLHGFGGTGEQWSLLRGVLPGHVRVSAVDLPGHGRNPRPVDTDLDTTVRDASEEMAAGGRFTVLGHSLGGLVALGIAARWPDLVEQVVLVGSASTVRLHPELLDHLADGHVDEEFLAGSLVDHHARPAALELVTQGFRQLRMTARRPEVWGIGNASVEDLLEGVTAPALLVIPTADRVVSPRRGRWLAARLAGSTIAEIPGAGHYVHLERPGDVLAAIAPVLASARGGPGDPDAAPATPPERVARYRAAGYYGDASLADHVLGAPGVTPDTEAVVDHRTRLTRAQLAERAEAAALVLERSGVRPGDRILVAVPNSVAAVCALLGTLRRGVVPVLATPSLGERELAHVAAATGARAMLIDGRGRGRVARERAQRLRAVPGGPLQVVLTLSGNDAIEPADPGEVRFFGPEGRPGRPGDVALYLLSGGTTGLPKPIPRTHRDYVYNLRVSASAAGCGPDTTYFAALPITHNFALGCPGVLGVLAVGGRVVLGAPHDAARMVTDEKATMTAAVPGVAHGWALAESRPSGLDLIQVGGARLYEDDARAVTAALGCRVQQVYGMAEGLLNFTALDDPEDVVLRTQGRPASPADEWRVVDGDGRDVAPGEPGELWVRGPYTVAGYLADAETNARAFTAEGYYRTGDIVRLDASGNFVVEGRLKDFVNRAGEKISALEIEALLAGMPSLRDVAVVPMPDPALGEKVCLYAVAGPGVTLQQVRRHLRDLGVAMYKLPEHLELIAALPTTPVGKVDRMALRANLCARTEVKE